MPLRPASLLAFASVSFAALSAGMAVHSWQLALLSIVVAVVLATGARGAARVDREDLAALRGWQAEAKALEAQLRDGRRAVDALADGLDAALLICDREGTILYANPPARRLFGHDSLRGQTLIGATLSADLERVRRTEARDEIAFAHPREWIGLASAWEDPAGERTFVSVYEITELRRLERTRKDFVANVSHELRTPLTIIRSYAETLIDEELPSEAAGRMLPRIVAEVDRLSTLTGDLLTLSVAESNPVRKARCDLAEVVRAVVGGLQTKATEKGLTLAYEGDDALPIQANAAQMEQVVLNLVDNAVNYTPKGSVAVSLRRADGRAILTVRDTGLGIASEHVERVFERFYRVDRGRSRATGGTGLGLSIVRHIVEAHGGQVALDTALHRGSTFTVELPLA